MNLRSVNWNIVLARVWMLAGLFMAGGPALGYLPIRWQPRVAAAAACIWLGVQALLQPVHWPAGILRPVMEDYVSLAPQGWAATASFKPTTITQPIPPRGSNPPKPQVVERDPTTRLYVSRAPKPWPSPRDSERGGGDMDRGMHG